MHPLKVCTFYKPFNCLLVAPSMYHPSNNSVVSTLQSVRILQATAQKCIRDTVVGFGGPCLSLFDTLHSSASLGVLTFVMLVTFPYQISCLS